MSCSIFGHLLFTITWSRLQRYCEKSDVQIQNVPIKIFKNMKMHNVFRVHGKKIVLWDLKFKI